MMLSLWASLVAQLVKNRLQCRRPWFNSWVRKICWRRDRLPTLFFLDFPGGSTGKESTCNEGDLGLIPGLGRSHGEGKGYALQYPGQRLYSPQGCKELDTTEPISLFTFNLWRFVIQERIFCFYFSGIDDWRDLQLI